MRRSTTAALSERGYSFADGGNSRACTAPPIKNAASLRIGEAASSACDEGGRLRLRLFTLGGDVAGRVGVGFAHIRALLRRAVAPVAGVVVLVRLRVHPDDGVGGATALGLGLGGELAGAGRRGGGFRRLGRRLHGRSGGLERLGRGRRRGRRSRGGGWRRRGGGGGRCGAFLLRPAVL